MKTQHNFLALLVFFFGFNTTNFAQVPDLGILTQFSVFTAVGAFTNVGMSNISSGIGTNVGALTGFPPGQVYGETHVADAISAQAALDAQFAYTYLSELPGGNVSGTTIGNDETILPGIYTMGAATVLNGVLNLDGLGDSGSVFIFKINGAFSSSAKSRMNLLHAASTSSIFWQINGAVEIGDSSVIAGTLLANGAIGLYNGVSLYGRAIATVGAISLHGNYIDSGLLPGHPLPVELIEFIAYKRDANVQIEWSTSSECNNSYFMLQRSVDGVKFQELAAVKGAGNSSELLLYSLLDSAPLCCTSYYQLKQFDFNGTVSISKMLKITFNQQSYISIYPNPFSTSANLSLSTPDKINKVELRMYNVHGKEISRILVSQVNTAIEYSKYPAGIYFYKLIENNTILQSGKLISQK